MHSFRAVVLSARFCTNCSFHGSSQPVTSILLPLRAFDVHPPVTQNVFYTVALLLQLRTHYPPLSEDNSEVISEPT